MYVPMYIYITHLEYKKTFRKIWNKYKHVQLTVLLYKTSVKVMSAIAVEQRWQDKHTKHQIFFAQIAKVGNDSIESPLIDSESADVL